MNFLVENIKKAQFKKFSLLELEPVNRFIWVIFYKAYTYKHIM